MWLGIVTLFPEVCQAYATSGVFGRAVREGAVQLHCFNPRDYAQDNRRTTDDRPYGGGAGMVMLYAPLAAAVENARRQAPADTPVILMSPQGQVFEQNMAIAQSSQAGLILVCGRYEGVDERFIDQYVDAEWSIGDFVLSGGELAALVVSDAIARHLPGVLGNSFSIIDESHLDGSLDYPQYTRPEIVDNFVVPDWLLSGDHRQISNKRRREALKKTFQRRPDMLTGRLFSADERVLLADLVAQMHNESD